MAIYDNDSNSSNNFLFNGGQTPGIGYQFIMRVEGIYDVPCRKIRAFTKANEYEYIQEGGINDYVHMRRKPISQPFTFQVERYIGLDYLDPLPNGADLILPIIIFVGCDYKNIQNARRTIVFTGCSVMSKEYGEMAAESSGLVCDTVTISYREMLVLEGIISLDAFNGQLKNPRTGAKEPDNEATKKEQAARYGETVEEYDQRLKDEKDAAEAEEKERRKRYGITDDMTDEQKEKKMKEGEAADKKAAQEAKEQAKKDEDTKRHTEEAKTEEEEKAKGKEEQAKKDEDTKRHTEEAKTEEEKKAKEKEEQAKEAEDTKRHTEEAKTEEEKDKEKKEQEAKEEEEERRHTAQAEEKSEGEEEQEESEEEQS